MSWPNQPPALLTSLSYPFHHSSYISQSLLNTISRMIFLIVTLSLHRLRIFFYDVLAPYIYLLQHISQPQFKLPRLCHWQSFSKERLSYGESATLLTLKVNCVDHPYHPPTAQHLWHRATTWVLAEWRTLTSSPSPISSNHHFRVRLTHNCNWWLTTLTMFSLAS